MNKIDEAINSIRYLECPTGQLENLALFYR